MRNEESEEELEESIMGYYPKSGSYVVEDNYVLVDDGNATLVAEYENKAPREVPKLESASFTLIRSFELLNGKIELKSVLIDGEFKVELNPDVPMKPVRVGHTFKLTEPLPTVTINEGTFKHLKSERLYEITIQKALVTQDIPGSFFSQQLQDIQYSFIATDAVISPTERRRFPK
jgi:hypothetical protein